MSEIVRFLEVNVGSKELFVQLIEQLQKDFLMATQHEVFENIHTAQELVVDLQRQLFRLIEIDVSKFSSLLYRIDVSEVVVDELQLRGLHLDEYIVELTYIILKREWQKVCFRNKL